MNDFKQIANLIYSSDEWMYARLVSQANSSENGSYSAAFWEWQKAMIEDSNNAFGAMLESDPTILDLSTLDRLLKDPLIEFGTAQARLYRKQGNKIKRFFRLTKLICQQYHDLINLQDYPLEEQKKIDYLIDFFINRVELGFVIEWTKGDEILKLYSEPNPEKQHLAVLSIINIIDLPVLIFNRDLTQVYLNKNAAQDFLGEDHLGSRFYETQKINLPLNGLWEEFLDFTTSTLAERTIEAKIDTQTEQRDYEIKFTCMKENMDMFGDFSIQFKDISDLKRQARQLSALRQIDKIITGSMGDQIYLSAIAAQICNSMQADSTVIFLNEQKEKTFKYDGSYGLNLTGYEDQIIETDNEFLARDDAEDSNIQEITVFDDQDPFSGLNYIENKGFVSAYTSPLISKGTTVGVLAVFYRHHLTQDQKQREVLKDLSRQTAIAIENHQLQANLQATNVNLLIAYDATLKGWAKALELRDFETKGHSERVVDMTLRLAAHLGFPEKDFINLQRGALLHDIGKLGVPDSILLKPGGLDDNEWKIMKEHPMMAFEWLSEISFLKDATDIPLYHHEKWDGTGYPTGLKGKSIPFSARLFAIVDVFDALSSDRPYRKAWSKEKIIQHIKEQSGKHFDPEIVDGFLQLYNT